MPSLRELLRKAGVRDRGHGLRLALLNTWYARRRSGPRVLYVDAFSQFMGRSNTEGLAEAFAAAGPTKLFDFRLEARRFGAARMNERLIVDAVRFEPDLVLFVMAESVTTGAIERIRAKTSARIAYFYPDLREQPPPFVRELGFAADTLLLPWDDATFTSNWLGPQPRSVAFWRHAVDPRLFAPRSTARHVDLLFMGNNAATHVPGAAERREFLVSLAKKGWSMAVFGEDWQDLATYPRVQVSPFVNGASFAQACSRARICLGFSENRVRRCTSWPRVFRTMASGGFLLTRHFPGLELDFANGRHLAWFRTTDEAVGLIEAHLVHEKERERIAHHGRELVLERHTWNARRDELFAMALAPTES